MTWRVVVPLKPPRERKTRLAERLAPAAREALALAMLEHVVAAIGGIAPMTLLCAERPARWRGAWRSDLGRGLNAELARARDGDRAFAVLHADLPLLAPDDVRALLMAAAANGVALAPDRHGDGTNALALAAGTPIAFTFGVGSFARFLSQRPDAAVVRRPGLALDVDTADDLDAAIAAGFAPPI